MRFIKVMFNMSQLTKMLYLSKIRNKRGKVEIEMFTFIWRFSYSLL